MKSLDFNKKLYVLDHWKFFIWNTIMNIIHFLNKYHIIFVIVAKDFSSKP